MSTATRMKGEERCECILKAVTKVFAEKGFDGTTTRELARAAGVSEALLYKHFPSKESLYAAMTKSSAKPGLVACEKMLALEPSTSTLVIMIHSLIARFVHCGAAHPERGIMDRLMARSLLGDGEFARMALEPFASSWIAKFEECLKAAAKTGDLVEIPVRRDLRGWLVHHIAVSFKLHLQAKNPAVDYRESPDGLIEQAAWFAMLGVGLRDAAIKKHYNPKALSLLKE